MKKVLFVCVILLLVVATVVMTGCSDAETASSNLSTAADNFEINRRVVFFNGITDKYLLTIEGRCSITADTEDGQLEVTVKTGPSSTRSTISDCPTTSRTSSSSSTRPTWMYTTIG